MYAGYALKSAEPEVIRYEVVAVGGATAITAVTNLCSGLSISYVSTGRYRLTWAEDPGIFDGATFTFQATTPGDVKAFVAVVGAYPTTAATFTLDVYCYESGSLADLAALEWLNGTVKFKRTAVPG